MAFVQSPSDVMDFSMVAEVLDAEPGSADISEEQLYVHAPNPVCQPLSVCFRRASPLSKLGSRVANARADWQLAVYRCVHWTVNTFTEVL